MEGLMDELRQFKIEARNFHRSQFKQLDRELEPKGPKLSLARALKAASEGRFRHGAPDEFEVWSRPDGDPQRIALRWEDLQNHDLTVASASGGGYLVQTETPQLELPLIQEADVARAGAKVRYGLVWDQPA